MVKPNPPPPEGPPYRDNQPLPVDIGDEPMLTEMASRNRRQVLQGS